MNNKPTWAEQLADEAAKSGVPAHLIGGLVRYVTQGIIPGDFLKAVLSNDLKGAFMFGDADSIHGLKSIMVFLYNKVPGHCHGSPEYVSGWYDYLQSCKSRGVEPV